GQDVVEGFLGDGVVHVEHHDGLAAALVPADLHAGDVDAVLAQDHANVTNHAGAIAVMSNQHVAGQGLAEREAVHFHNPDLAGIPAHCHVVDGFVAYLESELDHVGRPNVHGV